mgnify:CR=1 FL=1
MSGFRSSLWARAPHAVSEMNLGACFLAPLVSMGMLGWDGGVLERLPHALVPVSSRSSRVSTSSQGLSFHEASSSILSCPRRRASRRKPPETLQARFWIPARRDKVQLLLPPYRWAGMTVCFCFTPVTARIVLDTNSYCCFNIITDLYEIKAFPEHKNAPGGGEGRRERVGGEEVTWRGEASHLGL